MKRFAQVKLVLTAFALALGLSACGPIATIPALEERTRSAWSEVQNQYRRRDDLIPKLIEAFKGFAQQEREVLRQVADARAKAAQVQVDASTIADPQKFRDFQEVQDQLSNAVARLLATAERYPELKSSSGFQAAQSQVADTESRIAVARRDYLAAVRAHNRELRTIPGRWIAAMFHPDAKPLQTFTRGAGSELSPDLRF